MSEVIRLDQHRKPHFAAPAAVSVEITVYEDGTVTVWLADHIGEPSQFNWAAAKIGEGVAALLSEKAERTGTK